MSSHRVDEALKLFTEFPDRLFTGKVVEKLQGCIAPLRDNPEALESLKKLLENAGDTTHSAEILELVAHASVQKGDLEHARGSVSAIDAAGAPGRNSPAQLSAGSDAAGSARRRRRGRPCRPPPRQPLPASKSYPEELEEEIRTALAESELY